jgi:hypothetical protein
MKTYNSRSKWFPGWATGPVRGVLSAGLLALVCGLANAQETKEIQLTWSMFVTDGMVEQDVFVENAANSRQVRRIPVSEVAGFLDTKLYAAGVAVPFQPMEENPTDTYPKGSALELTLRDWLQAKGSGSYVCDGENATLKANFQGLVPNGVYTLWNFIDLNPPVDPWQGLLVPAGKRDGSQAFVTVDNKGNGSFEQVFEPCLQLSGTQSLAGLALAWHSNGETYGFSSGSMGMVTHAQLMTLFPGGPGTH